MYCSLSWPPCQASAVPDHRSSPTTAPARPVQTSHMPGHVPRRPQASHLATAGAGTDGGNERTNGRPKVSLLCVRQKAAITWARVRYNLTAKGSVARAARVEVKCIRMMRARAPHTSRHSGTAGNRGDNLQARLLPRPHSCSSADPTHTTGRQEGPWQVQCHVRAAIRRSAP
jgi:hypothetical protein